MTTVTQRGRHSTQRSSIGESLYKKRKRIIDSQHIRNVDRQLIGEEDTFCGCQGDTSKDRLKAE